MTESSLTFGPHRLFGYRTGAGELLVVHDGPGVSSSPKSTPHTPVKEIGHEPCDRFTRRVAAVSIPSPMSDLFDHRCECPRVGGGRRPCRSSINAKCEKPEIGAEAAISPGDGRMLLMFRRTRPSEPTNRRAEPR